MSLHLLPAADGPDANLRPLPSTRRIFSNLKLRAAPIAEDPLDLTPTTRAVPSPGGSPLRPTHHANSGPATPKMPSLLTSTATALPRVRHTATARLRFLYRDARPQLLSNRQQSARLDQLPRVVSLCAPDVQ